MGKYTVLKGDSLSLVAKREGWNWDEVLSLNEGVDLDNTQVGQVVNVPSTAAPTETQRVSPANVVNENKELEDINAGRTGSFVEGTLPLMDEGSYGSRGGAEERDQQKDAYNAKTTDIFGKGEELGALREVQDFIPSRMSTEKEGFSPFWEPSLSTASQISTPKSIFDAPDLNASLNIGDASSFSNIGLPDIAEESQGLGGDLLSKAKGFGTKVDTFMKGPGGTALAGVATIAGQVMQSKAIDKSLDKISGSIEDVKSAKIENIKGVTKSVDLITDTYAEERRLAGGTAAEDLRMALDKLTSSAGRTGGLKSGSIIEQEEDIMTSVEDSMGIFTEQQRAKSEAAVDELRITGRQEGERMTSAIESMEQQADELKTQKKKGWLDAGVSLVGMVNPAVGVALKLGMTAYDAYNA